MCLDDAIQEIEDEYRAKRAVPTDQDERYAAIVESLAEAWAREYGDTCFDPHRVDTEARLARRQEIRNGERRLLDATNVRELLAESARVRKALAELKAVTEWQHETYGNSTDPADRPAVGRLVGMQDAIRILHEHLDGEKD